MKLYCPKCQKTFTAEPMPHTAAMLRLYLEGDTPSDTVTPRVVQGFTHQDYMRCPGVCHGKLEPVHE